MYLSRAEVRALDHRAISEFGVPGIVLMENAGRGAAEAMLRLAAGRKVVVCCGKGNNGGDGLVIARHLDLRGISVQVLLFAPAEELSADASTNCTILAKSGIRMDILAPAAGSVYTLADRLAQGDWIVDALFGTGLTGPLGQPWQGIIECINASKRRILAVDIPSGLDCDTGEPLGTAIRASHTATFVAPKKGFANPRSFAWTGTVETISIGAPRALLDELSRTTGNTPN